MMLILLFDVSCTANTVKTSPLHIPDLHWQVGPDAMRTFCLQWWLHACLALRRMYLSICVTSKCRISQRTCGKRSSLGYHTYRCFQGSGFWVFQRPHWVTSSLLFFQGLSVVGQAPDLFWWYSVHWVPCWRSPCLTKEYWHRFLWSSWHPWGPSRYTVVH